MDPVTRKQVQDRLGYTDVALYAGDYDGASPQLPQSFRELAAFARVKLDLRNRGEILYLVTDLADRGAELLLLCHQYGHPDDLSEPHQLNHVIQCFLSVAHRGQQSLLDINDHKNAIIRYEQFTTGIV